jgi:FXSXX-COOH protein
MNATRRRTGNEAGQIEEPFGMDEDPTTELKTNLIDLSGLRLAALSELDNSALANSLRRIMAEATASPDAIAGFNSII